MSFTFNIGSKDKKKQRFDNSCPLDIYKKTSLYRNSFLGQFWRLDENSSRGLINKAALWEPPYEYSYKDWTFSRKYLWADSPGLENTYILSCKYYYEDTDIRRRRRSAGRIPLVSI